jgi:hypothetical protein
LEPDYRPSLVYEWREEWKQWKESEDKKCIVPLEMLFLQPIRWAVLPFLLFLSLLFIVSGIVLIYLLN